MIVVSVHLASAVTGEVTELARMYIDNVGGDRTHGDYRVRTLRGRSSKAFADAVVQREGRVDRHARLREHVWNLVAKALAATRYGTVS